MYHIREFYGCNDFNPRPPRGGRRLRRRGCLTPSNFNPRPPRGGRRCNGTPNRGVMWISIHAPREGGDINQIIQQSKTLISIHAPREGGDLPRFAEGMTQLVFQSTPPAGGGATPDRGTEAAGTGISIHAPREGGDGGVVRVEIREVISIHAPREGGDSRHLLSKPSPTRHFNPRPPRGGRPAAEIRRVQDWIFQSTPPARGATLRTVPSCGLPCISIHAPREGGDRGRCSRSGATTGFQSTPPARGATAVFL